MDRGVYFQQTQIWQVKQNMLQRKGVKLVNNHELGTIFRMALLTCVVFCLGENDHHH